MNILKLFNIEIMQDIIWETRVHRSNRDTTKEFLSSVNCIVYIYMFFRHKFFSFHEIPLQAFTAPQIRFASIANKVADMRWVLQSCNLCNRKFIDTYKWNISIQHIHKFFGDANVSCILNLTYTWRSMWLWNIWFYLWMWAKKCAVTDVPMTELA